MLRVSTTRIHTHAGKAGERYDGWGVKPSVVGVVRCHGGGTAAARPCFLPVRTACGVVAAEAELRHSGGQHCGHDFTP